MSERIKCQKNKKIIYNYLTGSPKNPEDSEFNYDDDWPINDGPLSGVKLSNLFGLALSVGYANINILNEESKEIYLVSQEYANAGIDILLEEYIENMDTIIDEWHSDIDDYIEDNDVLEKISNL